MTRDYHRWFARSLSREMELLIFGHAGPPILVFPTSMGAFFEYEDRGMVAALADKLDRGALRLFCLSSIDGESWYAKRSHPRNRVERHLHYEDHVLNEIVPLVRHLTRSDTIGVTGCSFGAYHAMALALRHPYTFTTCITMGGAFDISQFLDGYFDEDCYFLNPPSFLPSLNDAYYLDQFRRNKWVLVTGDRDICRAPNEQFSGLLHAKAIPHSLHVWNNSKHDWPYWRPMAQAYLP
ncbi:MAG: esterase family protein [Vicinamibacterales bacterium]